jgi:hypothetical protein
MERERDRKVSLKIKQMRAHLFVQTNIYLVFGKILAEKKATNNKYMFERKVNMFLARLTNASEKFHYCFVDNKDFCFLFKKYNKNNNKTTL